MPFAPEEAPTRPEGYARELRVMAERVRALQVSDIAVLRMLRAASTDSDEDMVRYLDACMRLVEKLLG
jgi:hypothetical protein